MYMYTYIYCIYTYIPRPGFRKSKRKGAFQCEIGLCRTTYDGPSFMNRTVKRVLRKGCCGLSILQGYVASTKHPPRRTLQ